VRSDWTAGIETGQLRLAGTIHAGHDDITVLRRGSFWSGLGSVVSLGMNHIATGSDHLMFLFALVLVARVTATAIAVVAAGTTHTRRDRRS
jgi:HupE / UreJ protein